MASWFCRLRVNRNIVQFPAKLARNNSAEGAGMSDRDIEHVPGFGSDPTRWVPVLKDSFERHLTNSLGQDRYTATQLGCYNSLALSVRDQLIRRWLNTQQAYYNADTKR